MIVMIISAQETIFIVKYVKDVLIVMNVSAQELFLLLNMLKMFQLS